MAKHILKMYNPKLLLHIFVDAANVAVSARLKQPHTNNFLHASAILSRAFRNHALNCFINELEYLAIVR